MYNLKFNISSVYDSISWWFVSVILVQLQNFIVIGTDKPCPAFGIPWTSPKDSSSAGGLRWIVAKSIYKGKIFPSFASH